MPSRWIQTIDPGSVADRLGADGYGIVIAVLGTGIDGSHPHFTRHLNLDLPLPVRHRDFTLLHPTDKDPGGAAQLDEDLLADEALIDVLGSTTHVAATIAGVSDPKDRSVDWEIDEPLAGVAPRCKLASYKVFKDDGTGSEYHVLLALQHVREVNNTAGSLVIQGVALAMSISQDAANYPCGRTPVCEAVEDLVESGVVVVASAGNDGGKGFGSITDPGNADGAITVGATGEYRPQQWGAMYFSSRGPTSDGRAKPDMLAPGKQIRSAVPASAKSRVPPTRNTRGSRAKANSRPTARYQSMDGTSMATGLVAGSVAAVLSVRPELIGKPRDVKQLLIATATDLGRDRYVQGRGLINLSRALDQNARVVSEPAAPPKLEIPVPRPPSEGSPDAVVPEVVIPETGPQPAASELMQESRKRFAVAFSFAGEQDEYVRGVVKALRVIGRLPRPSIFYYKNFEAELSRPDLDLYLQDIYGHQSELLVVMLSAEYESKDWTGLEWRALRELIKQRKGSEVMPVRFDKTHIPGLFSVDGYVSANGRKPDEIAELILDRLDLIRE